jgi:hypothetical protein
MRVRKTGVKVNKTANKCGFSLMEVNLAVLMIALGLLSLFSLFPAGLRESQSGLMDTQEAMFADHVLSTMEGNAQAITNWADWSNESIFHGLILANSGCTIRGAPTPAIEFPPGTRDVIRYTLDVSPIPDTNNRRYRVAVKVMSGAMGNFDNYGKTYYSEFIYCGM